MNEADKIARSMAKKARAESAKAAEAGKRHQAAQAAAHAAEAMAKIGGILTALASSGYPNLTSLVATRRGLLGGSKKVEVAGWPVASWDVVHSEYTAHVQCWLLSSGRFGISNSPRGGTPSHPVRIGMDFDESDDTFHANAERILEGLDRLHSRYTGG